MWLASRLHNGMFPCRFSPDKNNHISFCVDCRRLNAVTNPDSFPLPAISNFLDLLVGARYFWTLDLKSGYWQIALDPTTEDKTTFVTHGKLYEFNVMPFGLSNAGASYQHLMQLVFTRITVENSFIIFGRHYRIRSDRRGTQPASLREVFERLREANVKFKPSKMPIWAERSQIPWVGHIVFQEGIKPKPRKVSAVTSCHVPRTVKAVCRSLGLSNYYHIFVKGYAKVSAPLYSLIKKFTKFIWTKDQFLINSNTC